MKKNCILSEKNLTNKNKVIILLPNRKKIHANTFLEFFGKRFFIGITWWWLRIHLPSRTPGHDALAANINLLRWVRASKFSKFFGTFLMASAFFKRGTTRNECYARRRFAQGRCCKYNMLEFFHQKNSSYAYRR